MPIDGNGPARVGCVYRPQLGPERLASVARRADEAGVSELWLWEDCFLSGGISAAAIALSHSTRLTVGVGVLPVPMRNVAGTVVLQPTADADMDWFLDVIGTEIQPMIHADDPLLR